MKARRIFLVLLCTLTMGPASLNAQEPDNAISVDLFLPAMSPLSRLSDEEMVFIPLNVKYQRVLTEHRVLMLKMGLTYSWNSDGESILDIYPMLALEWHPFDTGLKGFYFGPSLFFSYSVYSHSGTTTAGDLDYSYWAVVGGNLGYEFVLRSNMVIDLIFGLGYGYSQEVDMKGMATSGFQVDETIGGVFVGYSF